ncbi:hypothetical protein OIU79_030468 [Salix purpurea]|uniref:Uncharacterized protein n=1 Tax=Salix purpurea TaxID=77065 RepID=A0A9Q0V8M3_SALPP|nr:hypothetical protein OIU79_030468 [Salix purpurea]
MAFTSMAIKDLSREKQYNIYGKRGEKRNRRGATSISWLPHLELTSWDWRSLFLRAGFTSVYLRVLSPQSGLTHKMFVSSTASILLIPSAISSVDGTLGEWIS